MLGWPGGEHTSSTMEMGDMERALEWRELRLGLEWADRGWEEGMEVRVGRATEPDMELVREATVTATMLLVSLRLEDTLPSRKTTVVSLHSFLLISSLALSGVRQLTLQFFLLKIMPPTPIPTLMPLPLLSPPRRPTVIPPPTHTRTKLNPTHTTTTPTPSTTFNPPTPNTPSTSPPPLTTLRTLLSQLATRPKCSMTPVSLPCNQALCLLHTSNLNPNISSLLHISTATSPLRPPRLRTLTAATSTLVRLRLDRSSRRLRRDLLIRLRLRLEDRQVR
jgi:hypothetical protein